MLLCALLNKTAHNCASIVVEICLAKDLSKYECLIMFGATAILLVLAQINITNFKLRLDDRGYLLFIYNLNVFWKHTCGRELCNCSDD